MLRVNRSRPNKGGMGVARRNGERGVWGRTMLVGNMGNCMIGRGVVWYSSAMNFTIKASVEGRLSMKYFTISLFLSWELLGTFEFFGQAYNNWIFGFYSIGSPFTMDGGS